MSKETLNMPQELDGRTESTPPKSPKPRSGIMRYLALMGPAFVAGAWQFGPGNLTSAVQAGSKYQYTLIWVIIVSTILMIFITDMSVRLGIKSPVSLVTTIKDHLGTFWGVISGIGVFLITLCFSVGNAIGTGLGLSLVVPHTSPMMWTIICSIAVFAILFLKGVYNIVEKALIIAIALMSVSFIVSAFISKADWAVAASGVIPTIPDGGWMLVIALVGTNFSMNAAFYASYATKERNRREDQYREITIADTVPGIVAPGVMTCLVIIVAAAVLGHTGEAATSIQSLATIFEPLAGPVGSYIFSLGFAASAFSSMIPNAIAGGTALSDAFGRGPHPSTVVGRIGSTAILSVGLVVSLVFTSSPVQLIVLAQALTVFIAPLLCILIIIMSNKKQLMGSLATKWWQNSIALIGFISVLALSIRLIINFAT